LLNNVITIT